MSVVGKPFGTAAQIANSATTYYTATNLRARIDKCTVCNTTAGAINLTIYKVPSGGSASATNTLISARSIAAGETYTCPEVVGHWLEAGGFISALASAATSLSLEMSGIEVSGT